MATRMRRRRATTGALSLIDEKAAAAKRVDGVGTDRRAERRERFELAQAVKLREHGNKVRSDAITVGN